jgi:hypothetical protein
MEYRSVEIDVLWKEPGVYHMTVSYHFSCGLKQYLQQIIWLILIPQVLTRESHQNRCTQGKFLSSDTLESLVA